MHCPNCGSKVNITQGGTEWECPWCGNFGALAPKTPPEDLAPGNGGCLISLLVVVVLVILVIVVSYIAFA